MKWQNGFLSDSKESGERLDRGGFIRLLFYRPVLDERSRAEIHHGMCGIRGAAYTIFVTFLLSSFCFSGFGIMARADQVDEGEGIGADEWAQGMETDGVTAADNYEEEASLMATAPAPYSGTCGTSVNWELNPNTGTLVISGSGRMTDFGSASKVPWYQRRTEIQRVEVDAGVENVGAQSFNGYTTLRTVILQNGLLEIGKNAFTKCTVLEEIELPDTVTTMGLYIFQNCTALKEVHLPEALTGIPISAFDKCTALSSIRIPDNVLTIDKNAFLNCTSLESVVFPAKLQTVQQAAFSGCTSLLDANLPDGVMTLGSKAFYGCTALSYVRIPGSVTSMGTALFQGCTQIQGVSLGTGITSIAGTAFSGCSRLLEVEIPFSVTLIGASAFANCPRLQDIYYTSTELVWNQVTIKTGNNYLLDATKHYDVTAGSIIQVEELPDVRWDFADGVLRIYGSGTMHEYGNGAMPWQDKKNMVTSIVIEPGVTSVADYAFTDCIGARTVSLPKGLESIGCYAFKNCKALEAVVMPDTVERVWENAFENCISIQDLRLSVSLRKLNANCFLNCMSLKAAAIPDSVDQIGNYAFQGCGALTEVHLPGTLTAIPISAFQDCASLTTIDFPVGISSLGSSSFKGCSALSTIVIPDSVKTIPASAFEGCSSLTEAALGQSVTSIEKNAFQNCTSLETVHIPSTIATVAVAAFNSTGLKNVLYGGTEEKWTGLLTSKTAIGKSNDPLRNAVMQYNSEDGIQAATGINLDKSTLSIDVDQEEKLTASLVPDTASMKHISWSSSDPEIASVMDGSVIARTPGTAVITATSYGGAFEASCTVTVTGTIHVEGVSLSKSSIELIEGGTASISARVVPENANDKAFSFASDTPSVAEVSQDGIITAKEEGSSIITVTTSDGGKTASCTVTVLSSKILVNSLTLDVTNLSLVKGDSRQLIKTLLPEDASDPTVKWESSNSRVAAVTDEGMVTAARVGKAVVSVSSADGRKIAKCHVTVTKSAEDITPYQISSLLVNDAEVQSIPLGTPVIKVVIESLTDGPAGLLLSAMYTSDGQMIGAPLQVMKLDEMDTGEEVTASWKIENLKGEVKRLVVFVVESMDDLEPISEIAVCPAG